MNQKGWEIFKPNCAPQSLELDHRSKKLKTANPLPFAPNLIPQYRDHLLAFQDCSFVTEAQYQFYAPILNHLPAIVTSLKDEKQPIQELATVIRKALMAAAPPLKETKPRTSGDRQATLFKRELKEINNKIIASIIAITLVLFYVGKRCHPTLRGLLTNRAQRDNQPPADIPLMLHGEDPEDHAADAQPANIPPARPPTPQPQVAPLVANRVVPQLPPLPPVPWQPFPVARANEGQPAGANNAQ